MHSVHKLPNKTFKLDISSVKLITEGYQISDVNIDDGYVVMQKKGTRGGKYLVYKITFSP